MVKLKHLVKLLFPDSLWFHARKKIILNKHKKVAAYCDNLISGLPNQEWESPHPLKKLEGKIIWQYWGQGYEHVPELVRICLDSVEKHKADCRLIRLTDENLAEYIDIPDFVLEKKSLFSSAFFSDLLRCMLLKLYGGVWLDATVFLTGPLPQRYFHMDFFVFQRDAAEVDKSYWEHAFAYYYGWYRGFKVNMLSSIFFAKRDSDVVSDMTKLLLSMWKMEKESPDYFLLQILFEQLVRKTKNRNCPIESDCVPHILQQIINADYKDVSVADALEMTTIHKLSYKTSEAVERLKSICVTYNL